MFKLFYAPKTCALAVHIALEEAQAPYQSVQLDFSVGEQRTPEYLALNPKGRVPALVIEFGSRADAPASTHGVLTETPAILAFIAQSFPGAQLAPLADPFAFAQLQAFNSYLCSTVHVAHAHRPRGSRWADDPAALEAMKRKVPQNMADCFAQIERHMFIGPWVMGDRYTVADGYLFTIAQWLEADGVDIATLPKTQEHTKRMLERDAVQRALAQEGG